MFSTFLSILFSFFDVCVPYCTGSNGCPLVPCRPKTAGWRTQSALHREVRRWMSVRHTIAALAIT